MAALKPQFSLHLIWSGLLVFLSGAATFAQVNVLTANYDNLRSNANLHESILNQANVNTSSFGKVGYFPVDGQIYAQPLYASGVQIQGQGKRNVVYVATMHNSVYAIDADAPQSTVPLWQVNLGPYVSSAVLGFTDVLPEVGILSTPVIDLARQIIYVVSDTLEAGGPVLRLHALSLANGQETLNGPVTISATVTGNGAGSGKDGKLSFDASLALQRPGLALANGSLYLGFGSHGDEGNWHGWLMRYDASNLHQISVLCIAPNGYGGSIWQAGRAPAIDSDGNLYVATSNGTFNGTSDFSESVLKLSPSLTLLDWYTPAPWNDWNINDWDLGSTGILLLPDSNLAVTGGKSGDLFLLNRDSMGHLGPKNSSTVQSIQPSPDGLYNMALWNGPNGPILFLQRVFDALQAYGLANGTISPLLSKSNFTRYTEFAGVAVSAGSPSDPAAIVWQTTGDNSAFQMPGTLHAFAAEDLSRELWNSDMLPEDRLGRFAKFVAPLIANGRVYVPTFSNELVIYGLLGNVPGSSGPTQIISVVNGASFLEGPVAPGELVTIFGANLGPAQPAGAVVNKTGHLTTSLAGTQVYFNGMAAPLLYTSANQVDALAPFGLTGSTSTVQVVYQGHASANVVTPVAPASPAFFTRDGTGGGEGSILNQDGSVNSYQAPADPGSIVVLYATGAGQTNPPGDTGKILGGPPLPAPVLPISVTIDNKPAEVLYAGAAPGMVEGVIQVNVRVPADSSHGVVQLVIQSGEYSSPYNVVWVTVR